MREEYDFSEGIKNPYIRQQKVAVTIRLDKSTVDYFKNLSSEVNIPYQTIINSYLADCAAKGRKPVLGWEWPYGPNCKKWNDLELENCAGQPRALPLPHSRPILTRKCAKLGKKKAI